MLRLLGALSGLSTFALIYDAAPYAERCIGCGRTWRDCGPDCGAALAGCWER